MQGEISNLQQIASLRRYTMTAGRERGTEVIDCDNGRLRFLLNVSCALDIMQLYHCGQNMSFLSKNAFCAGESDFPTRFEGGMLYTCGLDSVGDRVGYKLHGSFHTTPAEIIRAECNEKEIVVEAVIRNTALFGKNLVMHRKISSELLSDSVRIEDVLTNEGYRDEDYCLLYHINIGYPMLDAGAKILADIKEVKPRNAWSDKNKSDMLVMCNAIPCMDETCYFLTLAKPEASLTNEKLGKRFTVRYSGNTLPHFVEWRSMASGDYALGFEPCTTELDGGFAYSTVKPGEKISFSVSLSVENT